MVRAKFKVVLRDPGESGSITLEPVYSSDPSHENKAFWDATPSGKIQMYISNPKRFAQFELGTECFVDFRPASQAVSVEKINDYLALLTRLRVAGADVDDEIRSALEVYKTLRGL